MENFGVVYTFINELHCQ